MAEFRSGLWVASKELIDRYDLPQDLSAALQRELDELGGAGTCGAKSQV